MSGNPHSTRMTGTGPAFVSICNSKRVIPPPSVTDRDITQRHQLTSHSVTVRTVSASSCYRSRYYRPTLGIVSICNYKEGFQPTRVTDRDIIGQPLALSQSVTIRRVFSPPVLQIETNLKLGGSQTRLHVDINRNGPCPTRNRARNSHGASDRNRTCNPLITNQLRYRCATLAHLALSREAC